MFGLYTEKDVKRLVNRLREEYDDVLATQKNTTEELKEQNRVLRARVLELENERGCVSEAIVKAVAEGDRIKHESEAAAENERRELVLLAEKCRLLSDRLLKKYPDGEDIAAFASFVDELQTSLGEEAEESGFNMDDVLAPKEPLDLGKLCKELGLMEDEE